ncbi:MAG TPA: zf-HC2 domain-containing protein [Vicinamibacterales bacterium]|nr:zf-HC2 domain-containing protein [Vicinamibacterales bacterium]
MTSLASQNELRHYLLGALPDARAAALEEEYFTDEERAAAIKEAEYDLIEDYLDGTLAGVERERFERHYLESPVHQARVAAARALRARGTGRQSPRHAGIRSWVPRLAAAAAVLIAGAAVTTWLLGERTAPLERSTAASPSAPGASAAVGSPPPRASDVPQVQPREGRAAPPAIVAFTVSADFTRGAGERPLSIPVGATTVDLRLESPEGLPSGDLLVAVRSVDGREVWSGPGIRARSGRFIRVEIPAARLAPDDYYAIVSLAPPDGPELWRYSFRVAPAAR